MLRASVAAALCSLASAGFSVPSLPLQNAAVPGLLMPATGLGTGGYGQTCSAQSVYPECWDADADPRVATWVTTAVSTYLQLASSGGVPVVRIDSANTYQDVGAVGRGMALSGVPRAQIFLLSKVGNGKAMGYNDTLAEFAQILAAQQVSYVDALLEHWPTSSSNSSEPACTPASPAYNATFCRLESWRALVDIWQSGGARSVGVSNYNVSHLEEILAAGLPLPAINQIPYHIYRSSSWAETAAWCARHGVAVNSYSPLGVPDWHVFPAGTGMSPTQLVDPVVVAIAAKHARTPAAVLLNWLWALGIPSNPRTYSPAHMADDLGAYDFALDGAEVAALSSRPQAWCDVDNYYECAPTDAAAAPALLRGEAPPAATPSCGNATAPLDATRPNVLLIGDSISMTPPYTPGGYGHALELLLRAKGVAVQHAGGDFAGGQAGDTRLGIICNNVSNAAGYLNFKGTFDLVHVNYGLHDLADYGPTLPQLPLPIYGANLATIYKALSSRAKQVMWTSTTPVPNVTTSYGRTYALPIAYNKQAVASLTPLAPAGGLLVNDLWSDFISVCGAGYTSCPLQLPANVHLTPAGIDFAAASAAKSILAALGIA